MRDAHIKNAEDKALVIKNRGKSKNRWRNDRVMFNDTSNSRDRSQFKETRECFHYGKKGHIRMNCRHWKKEQIEDKDQKHDDEKDTTVVVDDEEVVVLLVQEQKCEHVDNNDDEWVFDLAATHYVVRTKELFITYKVEGFSTVKIGNTSYSKFVGIGDVCIKTNVGFTMILQNVQHVLNLRFNLISTPTMDRAGYCNHLRNGRWKLTKGPLVFVRGRICCGLYMTHVKACKKKFNVVGTIENTPQLRVMVNNVAPKRVKFFVPDSAIDGKVICDKEYKDGNLATCDDDEVKDFKDLEQGE